MTVHFISARRNVFSLYGFWLRLVYRKPYYQFPVRRQNLYTVRIHNYNLFQYFNITASAMQLGGNLGTSLTYFYCVILITAISLYKLTLLRVIYA